MRNAFTMIELIVVIVIVAILSGIAIPRMFHDDKLLLAAEELITNIRYTQHLAVMEDVFAGESDAPAEWERHRWRLSFADVGAAGGWTYAVFKDINGAGNNEPISPPAANPDSCGAELARDPLTKKCMFGGRASFNQNDQRILGNLALAKNRDIQSVNVSSNCGASSGVGRKTIGFDEYGRPFGITDSTSDRRINYYSQTCRITLTSVDNRQISVCVEPETGYTDYCD